MFYAVWLNPRANIELEISKHKENVILCMRVRIFKNVEFLGLFVALNQLRSIQALKQTFAIKSDKGSD